MYHVLALHVGVEALSSLTLSPLPPHHSLALVLSLSFFLLAPPTIVESFPEMEVFVTQPVSLTCKAQGSEPLSWTWKHDTQEVSVDGNNFEVYFSAII